MILDSIDRLKLYAASVKGVEQVLRFLAQNDPAQLSAGRYEMEDGCYVRIFEYETKPDASVEFESHEQYIDLQYILTGREKMYWHALEAGRVTKPYNAEKDAAMWNADETKGFTVDTGMFCVFFPHDLHAPGLAAESPTKVKKAVFKLPV